MSNYNTGICCCVYSSRGMKELTIESNGEEAVVKEGMPIISTVAQSNNLVIEGDKVYRVTGNVKTTLNISAKEAKKKISAKGITTKSKSENISRG